MLESEVELVPDEAWEGTKDSRLPALCEADAVVIIGATLLHDFAMHLRPHGFLALVGECSCFQPLSWFSESHEGHTAERAWHELWGDYLREAKRFSNHDLTSIIGEQEALMEI